MKELKPLIPMLASLKFQELSDALVQIWEEIPQDTISVLIRSMPQLSQACSQASGDHMNY